MIILADATPTNSQVGLWLQCLTLFVALIIGLITVVRFLRNDAEKREVSITGDTVAQPFFDKHAEENREDINALHTKIGASERATRDQILAITEKVGELSALNQVQNQRLAQIDAKLDRLIERRSS